MSGMKSNQICRALVALHDGIDPGAVSYRQALPVACSILGLEAEQDQARAFIRRHEKQLLVHIHANRGRLFEIYARDQARIKAKIASQDGILMARALAMKSIPQRKNTKKVGKPVRFGSSKVKPFEGDEFLQSYEWRRVRMVALKKYGPKCQCCGATPADGAVMNVDHIKPRKLFPQLALDVNNLQVLCHECNHGKGNWDMTDWRDQVDHLKSVLREK